MINSAISAERPEHQAQENVDSEGEPSQREVGSEVWLRPQEGPAWFQARKEMLRSASEGIVTSSHVHGHALPPNLVHSIRCPNCFVAHNAGFPCARLDNSVGRDRSARLLTEERVRCREKQSQTDWPISREEPRRGPFQPHSSIGFHLGILSC